MSFAQSLERLTEAANCGTRGQPPDKAIVQRGDLLDLLHHFHRLDLLVRYREEPRL